MGKANSPKKKAPTMIAGRMIKKGEKLVNVRALVHMTEESHQEAGSEFITSETRASELGELVTVLGPADVQGDEPAPPAQ
jgi:hypothetical protein